MAELFHLRRIPLVGADNVRDLGGYWTFSNHQTQFNRFIRSSSTHSLSGPDVCFLKNYGIKSVIDFRSAEEIQERPSVFRNCSDISYHHIPTFGSNVSHPMFSPFLNMDSKYVEIVENHKGWIRSVFSCMAECSVGILFNCATGKDRTGIIASLLLGYAGVSSEDIIADYCVSQVYLKKEYEVILSSYNTEHPSSSATLKSGFFSTKPDIMESLICYIQSKYGSIRAFLLECGICNEELESIRNKLINN